MTTNVDRDAEQFSTVVVRDEDGFHRRCRPKKRAVPRTNMAQWSTHLATRISLLTTVLSMRFTQLKKHTLLNWITRGTQSWLKRKERAYLCQLTPCLMCKTRKWNISYRIRLKVTKRRNSRTTFDCLFQRLNSFCSSSQRWKNSGPTLQAVNTQVYLSIRLKRLRETNRQVQACSKNLFQVKSARKSLTR